MPRATPARIRRNLATLPPTPSPTRPVSPSSRGDRVSTTPVVLHLRDGLLVSDEENGTFQLVGEPPRPVFLHPAGRELIEAWRDSHLRVSPRRHIGGYTPDDTPDEYIDQVRVFGLAGRVTVHTFRLPQRVRVAHPTTTTQLRAAFAVTHDAMDV